MPRSFIVFTILCLAASSLLIAQRPAPAGALARIPVKEVSIFKDGHAFVMHEGSMPVDSSGNVVMDYLPAPVLGTFWAYGTDPRVKVSAVTAGRRRVTVERTALKLTEMLESNIGAEVIVTEKPGAAERDNMTYIASILDMPRRSSDEQEATSPPNTAEKLPVKGELILLRTADGVKALPVDRIQDVVFKTPPRPMVSDEEFRNLLTLKLDWVNRTPAQDAGIGVVYLQKGLRWIPSYRIALDGRGTATARLQTVLINELTDLDGVTANLVIGVPSFAFKETLDPLSLLQSPSPLSSYFQTSDRSALSNAIASQVSAGTPRSAAPEESVFEAGNSAQNAEDLFLFTLKSVTLKKGERLSMPVTEQQLKYKDVYTLDLPFSAPPEVRGNLSVDQQTEMSRLLRAPRPAHKIRLTNSAAVPLTTAPAMIVQNERVLSQGTMTYTPPGAAVDLEIGKAVDVHVARTETEVSRIPNAVRVNGESFTEISMSGSITLMNYRKETVEVEVTREVLGVARGATDNGRIEKLNALDEYPAWWRYYNWPAWWNQMNGVGRVTWNVTLTPGQSIDLNYDWQYYWR